MYNKDMEEQKVKIQSLTGSPSPTAVSDVAKGGEGKTLYKHDEDEQVEMVERLKNGCDPRTADINEAYAMLFEGLAMIARSKS